MTSNYVYAIREIETGKLVNAKCGSGGKFYHIKGYAQKRCDEYNSKKERYEVVTYKLEEVINEPERESFESKLKTQFEKCMRLTGEKTYD